MASNISRIYTDSPLIDEIVYQCKTMILGGIILKDEEEANSKESAYSIMNADRYADIIEGKDRFELWEYDYNTLMKIPSITESVAIQYAKNNSKIPSEYRPLLMKLKEEEFLKSYEELNEYYRKLSGLPAVGRTGIRLTREQYNRMGINTFNYYKYIHDMTVDEINIIESFGILDEIKQTYPEEEYLNYLGDRKIDPYMARKTMPFGLLYLPPCTSGEVYNKFKDLLEKNRVFLLQTFYSKAFKFQSEYYDKFFMAMIIIQAFVDMIDLSPEYIIQRELFDLRTIQYIFESQGVEYFEDIPLKYQKRLIKNLNRLLKYKSSNKNLIDIASLFGFEDATLFKYYLFKYPIMLENGEYKHDSVEDPKTGLNVEDLEANYELKFVKVPIDGGSIDEAVKNPFNYVDYDEVTGTDIYWNGPYDKETVKHKILEHEFNLVVSKYMGLETAYSLTEVCMELSYFMNMILYSDVDSSSLLIDIPEINTNVKYPLIDCLIALMSLMYNYLDIKDSIIYNPIQAMDVYGFNFEVDMDKLATYIAQKGYTLDQLLHIDKTDTQLKYKIPENGYLSFNQLIDIYTNNIAVLKHVIHEMYHANDKTMYDLYRKIYQSLMVTKINFDYFRSIGYEPKTYREFLMAKNSPLFDVVNDCRNIADTNDRKNKTSQIINNIVDNIYLYIDEEKFRFLFHGIPTVSMDYLRQYLFKVLNFFKSYKVDFTKTNVVYKLDDKFHNKVTIIDKILFNYVFNKVDNVNFDDWKQLLIHLNPSDKIEVQDIMEMDISRFISLIFSSSMGIKEEKFSLEVVDYL